MSVGVGVGLLFLAREGLSFAMLRGMPDASERAARTSDERCRGGEQRPGGPPVRALACPASLKGVLSASAAAEALAARASRRAARMRTSCRSPTAARGRPRRCTLRSAASGGRPRCADPLGRPVRARWLLLPDGTGGGRGGGGGRAPRSSRPSSTRCGPRAVASASSSLAALDGGARRSCSSPRRHGDGRRRRGPARGRCSELPRPGRGRLRRATPPRRRARGSSGRRRARRPRTSRSSSGASRAELRPYAELPGARRRRRARRRPRGARRGARPRRGARARADRLRRAARRRVARRHRGGHGRPHDARGQGAGRGGRPPARARACAASSSAAACVEPLPDAETIALSGDPARAADDLVALGERRSELGRTGTTGRASASRSFAPAPGELPRDPGVVSTIGRNSRRSACRSSCPCRR